MAGALLDTGITVVGNVDVVVAVLILLDLVGQDFGDFLNHETSADIDVVHVEAVPLDQVQGSTVGDVQNDPVLGTAGFNGGENVVVSELVVDGAVGGLHGDNDGLGDQGCVENDLLAVDDSDVLGVGLDIQMGHVNDAGVVLSVDQRLCLSGGFFLLSGESGHAKASNHADSQKHTQQSLQILHCFTLLDLR